MSATQLAGSLLLTLPREFPPATATAAAHHLVMSPHSNLLRHTKWPPDALMPVLQWTLNSFTVECTHLLLVKEWAEGISLLLRNLQPRQLLGLLNFNASYKTHA